MAGLIFIKIHQASVNKSKIMQPVSETECGLYIQLELNFYDMKHLWGSHLYLWVKLQKV